MPASGKRYHKEVEAYLRNGPRGDMGVRLEPFLFLAAKGLEVEKIARSEICVGVLRLYASRIEISNFDNMARAA